MMFAAAALALILAACGGPSPDTSLVISRDRDLRNRVGELLPELSRRSGLELKGPVRVDRRSRVELERYLRYKLDRELPEEEARVMSRSYALLGLMDEEVDLREILLSVYTEQVAGFYDPDSSALFVLDDMPLPLLDPVLVHELVHALQDQSAPLDSLTSKTRGNDRQAAAQAAIEGHATLVMLEHLAGSARGAPVDLSSLPDLSAQIRPALQGMREQYPALASAPAIIRESLLFPYLEGASFVAALWSREEGRPAPFGARLPQSTEQILRPERAFGAQEDPPTELRVEPPSGFEVAYQNTLGQLELEILLEEHLGRRGRELAMGWDGDRYLLLRGPEGQEALVWASVWDSGEERDRFLTGLGGALDGFPAPASLEGAVFFGRPGAIFQVGGAHGLTVTVEEAPPR